MTDLCFEEALVANQQHILRYAKMLTRDPDEAQDILQETLEAAWKHRSKYDSERAAFFTWLTTIYRNVVSRRYRQYKESLGDATIVSIDDLLQPTSEEEFSGEAYYTNLDVKIALEQALNTLGGIHSQVIRMCFIGGSTFMEVANELGLTKRKVRRIVTTGLKRLRYLMSNTTKEVPNAGNEEERASDAGPGA